MKMTPREAYESALSKVAYSERFRAFAEFQDIADKTYSQNWEKFNRASGMEYGGIMHDSRGARHLGLEWAEKTEKFEDVVGVRTKRVYAPAAVHEQLKKWDAMYVESGQQALNLFDRVLAAPPNPAPEPK